MGRKKAKGAFRHGALPPAHPSRATGPNLDDGEPFVGQKLLDILEMEAGYSAPSKGTSSQSRIAEGSPSLRRSNRLRTKQAQSDELPALALRPAEQQDQAQMERQAQLYAVAEPHNPQFDTPAMPENWYAASNNNGAVWSVYNEPGAARTESISFSQAHHGTNFRTPTTQNLQPSLPGLRGYGKFQVHPPLILPPRGTLRLDHGYSSKVRTAQKEPVDEVVFKGRPALQVKADVAKSRRPNRAEQLKVPFNVSISKSSDPTHAPTPPKPADAYMQQALLTDPTQLAVPQPLLVVMDLNGTLIHRPNRRNPSKFVCRPFVKEFLDYLLSSFTVMVWSSARPENVSLMCKQLFNDQQLARLAAVWGRDKLGLTKHQYSEKVQVYKRLDQVWSDNIIATYHPNYEAGERWNQRNTVLIDDSALKANAQPFNLIQISEFVGLQSQMESDILRQVARYLEVIKHQQDVSAFIYRKPFKADAG